MTQDLERRLARLEAAEAIRTLIGRYAEGADRRNDPALMRPLFADDAVWEAAGFGRFTGGDAIAAELGRIGREQIIWTMHYMVSPTVAPAADGRTARAGWSLWELARIADASPGAGAEAADHWIAGVYDAELRREGERWVFTRVTLTVKLLNPRNQDWRPLR
ncbi:nuclear transport factor 2 family protein [Azospirillum sp.]|uniref:nuclear transport factor 2 family protein n=1 Tax=Azospirillum sp. TaxID=34012 RepID=UPI002D6745EA|nr:nuclear transport factor 2 family protein [Azospirillum sp.]HYD70109.1 nuclear transport factor 2 family protein [Azospirillum sp.]